MSTMLAQSTQPSLTLPNENFPSHTDTLFLEGSHPEGISLERLPPDTRRLLDLALPEEGLRLLAHMLRYATLMPERSLPPIWAARLREPSDQPSALVVVRSLSALAHTADSPCGPDHYGHLLIACEALGIVSRRVHHLGSHYCTVLVVALHPCSLTPGVLLHCQELERHYRNPRLVRLLRQIEARLSSLCIPPEPPSLFPPGAVLPFLQHMHQLVEQFALQGVPQVPLLQLIEQMLTIVLQTPALLSVPAPTRAQETVTAATAQQPGVPVDRNLSHPGRNLPAAPFSSLENLPVLRGHGRFLSKDGRKPLTERAVPAAETSPLEYEGGFLPKDGRNHTAAVSISDSLLFINKTYLEKEALIVQEQQGAQQITHASQESVPILAPFHPSLTPHGSAARVPDPLTVLSSRPPVQSTSLTRPISDRTQGLGGMMGAEESRREMQTAQAETSQGYHDRRRHAEIRREAGYYAQLLDGQDRWIGKLVRCVQMYPPHIRHLAVVDTLYRCYEPDWRGRPKSPGAWFSRSCERFAMREEEVPLIVRRWAATNLAYEQMVALFEQGYRRPEQVEWEAIPETEGAGTFLTPAEHRVPPGEERSMQKSVASAQEHLEYETATALAAQVMDELAAAGKHGTTEVLQESSAQHWMVLLVWEDGLEVSLLNEGEWKQYWEDVQYCTALQRSLVEANGARQATASRSW